MIGRRSRVSAVVAVLAMLLAVPVERRNGCSVCPVDCPMHGARHAGSTAGAHHVGCHEGGASTRTAKPADTDGCSMRAGCGHRDGASPAVFHAVLSPASRVVAAPAVRRIEPHEPSPELRFAAEPPTDPPRRPSV